MENKKELVLSLASGYNYSQLKPFVETLFNSGFKGDFVLFVSNITDKTRKKLQEKGVKLIFYNNTYPYFSNEKELNEVLSADYQKVLSPNSLRYLLYFLYLRKYRDNYKSILFSDIRDVVFQKNPFDYPFGNGLYCFLEDQETKIRDEKHNSFWIRHAFGQQTLDQIGNNTICCSGVTIGSTDAIMSYLEKMIQQIFQHENVGGLDQGIHNYLLYTKQLPEAVLVGDDEGPVTTLSYFKPFTKIRFNSQGLIINKKGELVNIVHQYDRHLVLLKKYNFNGYLHELYNVFKRSVVAYRDKLKVK